MTAEMKEMLAHLVHASAEINTAVREGFYVHMLPPAIRLRVTNLQVNMDTKEVDFDPEFDIRLQYEIVPIDPRKEIRQDHRDALSKRRSPDYQPPGGFVS